MRISPEEALGMLTWDVDLYMKDMKQFAGKFMFPTGRKLFTCGIGGCVDPYGYLYPCTLMRHPDTGYDLRRGSLEDAFDTLHPRLRTLEATNPDYLRRCARCFLKGLCEQCPAKSWAEHGTLDTPVEYLCETAHFQARFLGLLKVHERSWEVVDWQERIRGFSKWELQPVVEIGAGYST
jgi:radical SAM protein with 4Fe4S-binding SPASM domain